MDRTSKITAEIIADSKNEFGENKKDDRVLTKI